MKVYIVTGHVNYEGFDIKAVVATREEAEVIAEKFRSPDHYYDSVEVGEWVLGEVVE